MPAGRPPIYDNVEQLEEQINAYFDGLEQRKEEQPDGSIVTIESENPTITGLAYYLGFESRQSFYDYEKNSEFSYAIKRARLAIEGNYEKALFSKNPTGPIFALKNFGWKDTQEIKHDLPKGFLNIDPLDDTTDHGTKENSPA